MGRRTKIFIMKSPIYYVNLTGHIKNARSKKVDVIIIKDLVVKGTLEQIKTCHRVKFKFLKKHLKSSKKAYDFDLNRLKITEIIILKNLGHGINEN